MNMKVAGGEKAQRQHLIQFREWRHKTADVTERGPAGEPTVHQGRGTFILGFPV